jgi:hypothetical protein
VEKNSKELLQGSEGKTPSNIGEILERKRAAEAQEALVEAQQKNLKAAGEAFAAKAAGAPIARPVDDLMQWFEQKELPEPINSVFIPYNNLASAINAQIKPSYQRTVALEKLLESRDAVLRALVGR